MTNAAKFSQWIPERGEPSCELRDFSFKCPHSYTHAAGKHTQKLTCTTLCESVQFTMRNCAVVRLCNATSGGIRQPNLTVLCWKDILRKFVANPAQLQLIKPLFSLNTSPPMKCERYTICSGFFFYGDHMYPPPSSAEPAPASICVSINHAIHKILLSLSGAARPSARSGSLSLSMLRKGSNIMSYRGHTGCIFLTIDDVRGHFITVCAT